MNRYKKLSIVLLLISSVLSLAACGPGGAPPLPTTAPAEPTAAPQVSAPTQAPPTVAPTAAVPPTPEPAPTTAPPAEPVVVVFADGTEPASLYVPRHTGPPATINYLLYDTLIGHNDKFEPDPEQGLATSWEVGDDNVTWTFHLREGVKFHDGTDFDANAAKVTIDTLKDPDTGAVRAESFVRIKEAVVVDPLTVQIVTDGPLPDLPFLLMDRSTMIISPQAMADLGVDGFGLNPVGTGPFKFVEWIPSDHITFEANPDYWRGSPKVDQIIYKRVQEDSVRTAMLKTGDADIVLNIPAVDLEDLRADPNIEVVQAKSLTTVHSELKQTQPPFSIKEVRLAMQLAVDQQSIIDNIMYGAGTVVDAVAPVGIWGTVQFQPRPYDPDRAKELLAQAGYPNGFEGNIYYVSGRWAGDEAVTQAMQAYWMAIGINMNLVKQEMAETVETMLTDPDQQPGWASQQLRSSAYLDYHLFRLYTCEANDKKNAGYCNPAVDDLIVKGRSTFNLDERYPYYAEVQEIVWEDQPFVHLFVRDNLMATLTGVSGYESLATGDLRLFNVTK